MKEIITFIALAPFFLAMIPFTRLPSESQVDGYHRYREEYARNLKNPLIQRYRKLSYDTVKETELQENKSVIQCSPPSRAAPSPRTLPSGVALSPTLI